MNIIFVFERIIHGKNWLYNLYYILWKQHIIVSDLSESLIWNDPTCLFYAAPRRVKICENSLTANEFLLKLNYNNNCKSLCIILITSDRKTSQTL